jgi:hypothetical protein
MVAVVFSTVLLSSVYTVSVNLYLREASLPSLTAVISPARIWVACARGATSSKHAARLYTSSVLLEPNLSRFCGRLLKNLNIVVV